MLGWRPKSKRPPPVSRIDWEARDVELARRVEALVPDSPATERRMQSPQGTAELVYPASSRRKHANQLPRFTEAARLKSALIRFK